MFDNPTKRENFYHVALIYEKRIAVGTSKGDKYLRQLLLRFGSFEGIYSAICDKKEPEEIISELPEKRKGSKDNRPQLKPTVNKLMKLDLDYKVITVNDKSFPQFMKERDGTTPVLYYVGDIKLLEKKSIAVVGTRKLEDRLDIRDGEKILQRLLGTNHCIVSGLAEGCDTLGHKYTINNGGSTVAVLGTTLEKHYPKSNSELQDLIAKEHLLVSQYPIGIRTFGSYFAHRNITTVSLASEGIVVIRAGDGSGTLHAVRECVKQEKPLYVLENNFEKQNNWIKTFYKNIQVPNRSNNTKNKKSERNQNE